MGEIDRCYHAALRLLEYRWRSEKELDDRLHQKGYSDDAVKATIERLREENWLDDRRFAAEFARSRRLKHLGRYRIARELESKGVDRLSAAEASRIDAAEERTRLAAACQKRIRSLTRLRGFEFVRGVEGRRKLTAYLLRQGYDYGEVLAVIDEELGK